VFCWGGGQEGDGVGRAEGAQNNHGAEEGIPTAQKGTPYRERPRKKICGYFSQTSISGRAATSIIMRRTKKKFTDKWTKGDGLGEPAL